VRLLEPDVGKVGAVPGVPAQRRPTKPPGLIDQQQHELKRVREAHEVELGRGGERDRRVASVKRAT